MKWHHTTLLVLLSAPLCIACASAPSPNGAIAFTHVSVLPMDQERLLRDQTVVVADGQIVAMGSSSKVKVPRDAQRVDGRGRYLLPALCDMHVHQVTGAWDMMLPETARVPNDKLPYDRFLFPYIANGVTTVQELSASREHLQLRDRIARGELLGPRMILGVMIDGPDKAWPPPLSTWVATPDEARAAVRRAKADGFDKMKVYSFLSRESYDAIVATAKEVDMDVIGHVPMALSVDEIVDAGQIMIAHSEELAKHAGGDYSAENVDRLASRLVDGGVWMIPTLVTTQSIVELFDAPQAVFGRPEAVYYRDPLQVGVWTFVTKNLYEPIPAPGRTFIRDAYTKFQRPLTKAIQAKKGRLLAGSDSILPGLVPGFALQRELRELVDAGLTPYEALRTSTTAPFEYLGEAARRGSVAVGQQSDLILVDANPLVDITAASKISGVLVRGRWIGGEEIRKTMQAIADAGH